MSIKECIKARERKVPDINKGNMLSLILMHEKQMEVYMQLFPKTSTDLSFYTASYTTSLHLTYIPSSNWYGTLIQLNSQTISILKHQIVSKYGR